MTGELAQAIALAAHGNAALAGDGAAGRALTLRHDAFTVAISVAFVRAGASVATTPAAWFDHLHGRRARRLVLTRLARRTDWLPDHEAVAFAGGSGVMIAADTRPAPELWAGEWRANFTALHQHEPRVWDVVYHAAEPPVPVRADEPPAARYELERTHERLRTALEATIAFAGKTDWTTGFFAPALAMLSSAEVLVPARGLELQGLRRGRPPVAGRRHAGRLRLRRQRLVERSGLRRAPGGVPRGHRGPVRRHADGAAGRRQRLRRGALGYNRAS